MQEYARYARQLVLKEIGREGQLRLEKSCVAVVGVGALGSVAANLLARAGVGRIKLIDRDYLEINNLQRQVLYDEADLAANLPKAVAAQKKLQQINSEIKVEAHVTDVNVDTIKNLLDPVDIIIDGTDNFETRFLINDFCLKHKIPWVYGGAVRTEGMSYVIVPGEGPCLRCLFGEAPGPENIQTCDQVGILAPVAHMIASFQTIEAIKLLSGHRESVDRQLWKMDLWNRMFKAISLEHLEKNPCSGCRDKDYPYLERKTGTRTVTLCGRNSVQIFQHGTGKVDLKVLAEKLRTQGKILVNDYLLKYSMAPYEITVFPNGRAIVKGTEDEAQAKSLYAKHIGA